MATSPPGTHTFGSTKKKCGCAQNFCPQCGLPACRPQKKLEYAPGALMTTYDRDYDGKKGRPDGLCGLAFKDRQYVPPAGQFQNVTTQRADYTPKQGLPQRRGGPDRSPPPYRPFAATTTYNTFHTPKPLQPKQPPPPKPMLESPPFFGITSHKADYPPHKAQPVQHRKHYEEPLNLPFMGNSTYRDDFGPKPIDPKKPRPPATLLPSKNDPHYTTYGSDFTPKPLEARPPGRCCDEPAHAHSLEHSHEFAEATTRGGAPSKLLGTTTGKLYSVR